MATWTKPLSENKFISALRQIVVFEQDSSLLYSYIESPHGLNSEAAGYRFLEKYASKEDMDKFNQLYLEQGESWAFPFAGSIHNYLRKNDGDWYFNQEAFKHHERLTDAKSLVSVEVQSPSIILIGSTVNCMQNMRKIDGIDPYIFTKQGESLAGYSRHEDGVMFLDTNNLDNEQVMLLTVQIGLEQEKVKDKVFFFVPNEEYPINSTTPVELDVKDSTFRILNQFKCAFSSTSNDNTIYFSTFNNSKLAEALEDILFESFAVSLDDSVIVITRN